MTNKYNTAAIDRAMKARENLRPALGKVFQSSIFDILRQSDEQIDIEQSKRLRDFLHRSRFDSTLLTNDGCLDITHPSEHIRR